MSLIFDSAKLSARDCPKCRENPRGDFAEDKDIECRRCKMIYRLSVSKILSRPLPSLSGTDHTLSSIEVEPEKIAPIKLNGAAIIDDDEEMALFRRVRIRTSIIPPTEDSRHINLVDVSNGRKEISALEIDSNPARPEPRPGSEFKHGPAAGFPVMPSGTARNKFNFAFKASPKSSPASIRHPSPSPSLNPRD